MTEELERIFPTPLVWIGLRSRTGILEAVARSGYESAEEPFRLGISIGIVALDGSQGAGSLLHLADPVPYEAKNTGRNRVVVSNSPNQLQTQPAAG